LTLLASQVLTKVFPIPRVARIGFRTQTARAGDGKMTKEMFGVRQVKVAKPTVVPIGMCRLLEGSIDTLGSRGGEL
jgi:hypothetical protein